MLTKVNIKGYRIYEDFTFTPNRQMNLIVGGNESGKSTLLEGIALALTGRINGRTAVEELNPYWFNTSTVRRFVQQRRLRQRASWPEIVIELFLESRDELQGLCGAHNSANPIVACPGLIFRVHPNPEYDAELEEWAKDPSMILPVEYYSVEWKSFADTLISRRPRHLATAVIDSRTVRSSTGVDYHMRQILNDQLEPAERASIALAYRQVKASMSESVLKPVNDRICSLGDALHAQPIALAMDQSARTSWEGAVTPHVGDVPFSMSGQGQQAAIKISMAMSRQADRTSHILVEEPENHLSHTSLTVLLDRMCSIIGDHQQIFVSTHSSYVLNRLGIDAVHLLSKGRVTKISGLEKLTVRYFQKLPGYDTLRMALAPRLVLVEGPSDEIIFERVFRDVHGKLPMACGVDIVSVRGISFSRCLELCARLDKTVAVVRDNDGSSSEMIRSTYQKWITPGQREVFVGENASGNTLEPQMIAANGEESLRRILRLSTETDILTWMTREKTEAALRIAGSKQSIIAPSYLREAAEFIRG